mmetsp:Transcript_46274/g.107631  ORF Transcript_46274/g.107631 Transcript_46274/m.107631 type:complete len:434 (-) Transcript_46274:83-1384(-)
MDPAAREAAMESPSRYTAEEVEGAALMEQYIAAADRVEGSAEAPPAAGAHLSGLHTGLRQLSDAVMVSLESAQGLEKAAHAFFKVLSDEYLSIEEERRKLQAEWRTFEAERKKANGPSRHPPTARSILQGAGSMLDPLESLQTSNLQEAKSKAFRDECQRLSLEASAVLPLETEEVEQGNAHKEGEAGSPSAKSPAARHSPVSKISATGLLQVSSPGDKTLFEGVSLLCNMAPAKASGQKDLSLRVQLDELDRHVRSLSNKESPVDAGQVDLSEVIDIVGPSLPASPILQSAPRLRLELDSMLPKDIMSIGGWNYAVLPSRDPHDPKPAHDMCGRVITVPTGWEVFSTSDGRFDTTIRSLAASSWGTLRLCAKSEGSSSFQSYATRLRSFGTPGDRLVGEAALVQQVGNDDRTLKFTDNLVSGRVVIRSPTMA